MKNMSIGDIRPREEEEEENNLSIPIRVIPSTSTSTSNDQAQPIDHATHDDNSQVQDQPGSSTSPSTSTQEPAAPPRIHYAIAKDHPMDQIMSDISKGVQTQSCVASFCEHYSFVSSFEPNRVDEALMDLDCVNAMHEELNNFTRNQVWELVERSKNYNVIGTNGFFEIRKMKMVLM